MSSAKDDEGRILLRRIACRRKRWSPVCACRHPGPTSSSRTRASSRHTTVSERTINGTPMQALFPGVFLHPHPARTRDEPHINAPGILERVPRPFPVARRPTEPDDPPDDADGDGDDRKDDAQTPRAFTPERSTRCPPFPTSADQVGRARALSAAPSLCRAVLG